MADGSKIEWTDATWNPVTGCTVVSPGCTNCYAMRLAGTRMKNHPSRAGLTTASRAGPVWNGQVRLNEEWLGQPLRWTRPRMVFVCAHGDLFHEAVSDEWLDRVFAVMALCPQHTFQVLTKRAERMCKYSSGILNGLDSGLAAAFANHRPMPGQDWRWPLKNVWFGVSIENQDHVKRWWSLYYTSAATRFVSFEPLLGPVRMDCLHCHGKGFYNDHQGTFCRTCDGTGETLDRLDWAIVGGESGPRARPMHPDWAHSLHDRCADAGVPFFFKQWGEFDSLGVRTGKKVAGRTLGGVEHNGFPV